MERVKKKEIVLSKGEVLTTSYFTLRDCVGRLNTMLVEIQKPLLLTTLFFFLLYFIFISIFSGVLHFFSLKCGLKPHPKKKVISTHLIPFDIFDIPCAHFSWFVFIFIFLLFSSPVVILMKVLRIHNFDSRRLKFHFIFIWKITVFFCCCWMGTAQPKRLRVYIKAITVSVCYFFCCCCCCCRSADFSGNKQRQKSIIF